MFYTCINFYDIKLKPTNIYCHLLVGVIFRTREIKTIEEVAIGKGGVDVCPRGVRGGAWWSIGR